MTERIQLSRAKGWKMPPNTVKVDRTTRYGNPFKAGLYRDYTAADAVNDFRRWILGDHGLLSAGKPPDITPLRGKNLACWCKPGAPCHADVLLELARISSTVNAEGTTASSDVAKEIT